MKPFTLTLLALMAATPALANYGDTTQELAQLTPAVNQVTQPLHAQAADLVSTDMCRLPADFIVAVPTSFASTDPVHMACVTAE